MPLDDEILGEATQARDRLIAAQHEVDAARADYYHAIRRLCAAGGSLREIADALGLSHQRVHQIVDEGAGPLWGRRLRSQARRRRRGFRRFTEDARAVVVAAEAEARGLDQDHVGTEHVLLGLLATEGLAATVLGSAGVRADALRERVERGPGSPSTDLPFAADTKRLLERSFREALSLGHDYIGTEHLLLACADDDLLKDLGVDGDAVRAEVHRGLAA